MPTSTPSLFYAECDTCGFYIMTDAGWEPTDVAPKPGDHIVIKSNEKETEMLVQENLERVPLKRKNVKLWMGISPKDFRAPVVFRSKVHAVKLA